MQIRRFIKQIKGKKGHRMMPTKSIIQDITIGQKFVDHLGLKYFNLLIIYLFKKNIFFITRNQIINDKKNSDLPICFTID